MSAMLDTTGQVSVPPLIALAMATMIPEEVKQRTATTHAAALTIQILPGLCRRTIPTPKPVMPPIRM